MRRYVLIFLVLLQAACATAPAARGVDTLSGYYGVSAHFNLAGLPEQSEFAQMRTAGFNMVRTDLYWSRTEKKPGEYDWTDYENLAQQLQKEGLRPMFILDYGNDLYGEPSSMPKGGKRMVPRTAAARAAYARWAAATAKHFAQYNPVWEIWNEPNLPHFWPPEPNASEYAALAGEACREIRKAVPGAAVIGPSLSGIPGKTEEGNARYLREVLKNKELAGCLDAVSVHPYRGGPPEGVTVQLDEFDSYVSTTLPVGVSEWGYSSMLKADGTPVVTEEMQAAYVARMRLVRMMTEMPFMVVYDWRNDGTDAYEREHNFGILTSRRESKPAYEALVRLEEELKGFRLERKLDFKTLQTYGLQLKAEDGEGKIIAWAVTSTEVVLPVKTVKAVRDMYGKPLQHNLKESRLPVGPLPVYVSY